MGLVLLAACSEDVAIEIPDHTEQFYVNDYAEVLDYETENAIIRYEQTAGRAHYCSAGCSYNKSLNDRPLEEYSLKVLRDWGIGQKEQNNGVLYSLSVDDRQSRIEVGYGLEALPDAKPVEYKMNICFHL